MSKDNFKFFKNIIEAIIFSSSEPVKTELLEKTIEVGEEAGALVTSYLKKPQDLEYEKVFYPFIIFSKKRYVGNKYEFEFYEFSRFYGISLFFKILIDKIFSIFFLSRKWSELKICKIFSFFSVLSICDFRELII